MNLKAICTSILIFGSILLVSGQSKEILARSAMLNAEESYNNGNYSECQNYLKDAEANLDKTNSAIQYLKVKSWMAMGTKDQYNKDIWSKADAELKRFFELTTENSYVPEKYDEMLLSLSKIKKYIAEAEERKRESQIIFNPNLPYGTMSDNDGNTYKTIQIGTQVWMAENLKTTKYRNGDQIEPVADDANWGTLTAGAYCWYNKDAAANKATYGALYNWYAVNDSRNIAPAGWHVASDAEWTTLTNYLVSTGVSSFGLLKETGFSHWLSPNTGATDSSGFTALPGGNRYIDGAFNGVGGYGLWWSSSAYGASSAWGRSLGYDGANVSRANGYKQIGFSVRCVRD